VCHPVSLSLTKRFRVVVLPLTGPFLKLLVQNRSLIAFLFLGFGSFFLSQFGPDLHYLVQLLFVGFLSCKLGPVSIFIGHLLKLREHAYHIAFHHEVSGL
jgi:hypothetical protein